MVKAIRGATTVEENTEQEILDATCELLKKMIEINEIDKDDIISIIFSVTMDLNATFPAVAARRLGWTETALMSTYEIDVPGSLRKCIRVLMHINTEKKNSGLKFVYQRQARLLRPDLLEQNQRIGG
jgi:chorismate mutase